MKSKVLGKTDKSGSYEHGKFFRDIWNFLQGDRLRFSFFWSLRLLTELVPFALIYFLGKIIDFFTVYDGGNLNVFYWSVGFIGILGVAQVWLRFIAKFHIGVSGARTRKRVRIMSMSKLMDLDLEWHEGESSGRKIRKINRGVEQVYKLFSNLISNAGSSVIVGIVGSMSLFVFLGWKYALFGLVYALIFLGMESYYNRKITYWTEKLNKIDEKIAGKFQESASNVLAVKSLGLRKNFEGFTKKHEKEYYDVWLNAKKSGWAKLRGIRIFGAIGYTLFLLLVGLNFVDGLITLGSILIFVGYFQRLQGSLDKVSDVVSQYINIKTSVGRLMTILGVDVFDREGDDLFEVPENWKKIEFKDVSFRYKEENVLDGFNLEVKRGEKIGIVGRSGSGKSTITKLLLGLYNVKKGSIEIDGIDINKFKHSSITNTITAVLQDSEMFDLSLEDNISISSGKKDRNLLIRAIGVSSIGEIINKLPRGLKTLLGEKGYKVSGGERQRIGIARAVYKNSPVLLLDEATSHLDSKTEENIQDGIEKELGGKTLLVVAHRLSTLKNMDRIIFMEKGKVAEEGGFDELVKKRDRFYGLWKLQNRGGRR
jgi:ABC-type multidrug transport system fused ATPase/permease subunit